MSRTRQHARDRALVVIVSDLRGPRDWAGGLRELCVRHDVIVCEIRDPAEESLPDVGEVVLVDPGDRPSRARRHGAQAHARALRRRRRRGSRAGRPRHPLGRRPSPRCSPPATTGCGRSSSDSPTARCCDDVRVATRAARARRAAARARCCCSSRAGARPATRSASATSACSPQVVESTRSPWRFVPPALLLAALAALAVGLARPQVSVTAERKQGTVVLALDRSGSMLAQDVDPDRMTASRKAAQSFVKGLPSGFAVGVVTFSDSADAVSAPSREKAGAERAIAAIQAGGGTAIGDALERSLGLLGVTSATQARRRQGPRDPPALRRLEHAGRRSFGGHGRGQARRRADLHDRARHAGRRRRPAGARPGHRHDPRAARPRGAQGDRARDRRRVVHRARRVEPQEGLRPHRDARQLDQGAEGSHVRRRGCGGACCCSPRRAPPGRSGAPHDVRRSLPADALLVVVPLAVVAYVVLRAPQPPCHARRRESRAVAEPHAAPAGLAPPRAARAAAAGAQPAARRRGAAAGQPAERPEGDDGRARRRHVELDGGDRRHARAGSRPPAPRRAS